jgi:hypothetical protein
MCELRPAFAPRTLDMCSGKDRRCLDSGSPLPLRRTFDMLCRCRAYSSIGTSARNENEVNQIAECKINPILV